ncbi:MAG TPA: RpiB/LacA/LacB family sugar-phosphate isomerase [Nakamurella sp.]
MRSSALPSTCRRGSRRSWRYPHVAVTAARKVARGEADRVLLICGTGLGVAISANTSAAKVDAISAYDLSRATPPMRSPKRRTVGALRTALLRPRRLPPRLRRPRARPGDPCRR